MLKELLKKDDIVKVFLKRQETDELLEYDIPWVINGSIFRITAENEIEIVTDQMELELQKNKCYVLYMFSYEKVFLCDAYFQSSYTEEQERIISFELLSPLERIQRRMHHRISCHAKMYLYRLGDKKLEEGASGKEVLSNIMKESNSEEYEEAMIDISAGGIRFNSKVSLRIGEYVFIKFDVLEGDIPLRVETFGQVIYSELFRNEQRLYDVRLKFLEMSESIREKIIHYVFAVEREKRRLGGRIS